MSSIVIAGDTSGTVTLQAPAVAGSTTVNLPSTPGNNGASAVVTTDSSGNLGLGVTPSAWGSGYTPIQGSGYSLYSGNTVQMRLSANEYFSSAASTYRVNGAAALYQQSAGVHSWHYAPSGTAGNAISFTQAMTLDAGGNLGVGTSSPGFRLDIAGGSGRIIPSGGSSNTPESGAGTLNVYGATSGITTRTGALRLESYSDMAANAGTGIAFSARYISAPNDGSYTFAKIGGYKENGSSGTGNGYLAFATTTSPGDLTERARIDSSGNLLVGTTSVTTGISGTETTLCLKGNSASKAASFVAVNAAGTGTSVFGTGDSTVACYAGTVTNHPFVFQTNNTERARITSAGDVAIGSTTTSGSKLYVQGVAQATGGVQDSAIEAWLGDDGSYGKTGTRAAIKAVTSGVGRGATPYGLWVSCTDIDVGTCISAYNLANGVYGTQTATLSEVSKDLGAYSGGYCHYAKATTTSSGGTVNFYFGEHNGTTRYIVYLNGGIANYQANNVNLSDRREKTDFAPAKNYLDTICAIPVQTFKYIDQTDDAPTLGVVAQDVQAVAPELVCESDWASEGEEKKMRLSIYQTDLQYALMKCIQELNAKVEALTAELNTLKGQA